MKKTLGTIQSIMKVGRVISIVVLVFAIIGMVGSLIGGICVFAVGEDPQKQAYPKARLRHLQHQSAP